MQSIDPKDRHKYTSSTPAAPITPSKRTQSYYVDPTVPTIEELREQAEAEKKQVVEGREEWAVNKEIAKVGEWETVVAQPPPAASDNSYKGKNTDTNASTSTHDQAPEFQDDDEDEEDLHSFKIKEKELDVPVHEDDNKEGEEVTFKKRKLADSGIKSRKKKPLRKKE